ncbi:MAG: GNAT family N-acetyltransferase [Caldilineaceae bacterium]
MTKFQEPGRLVDDDLTLVLTEKRPGNSVLDFAPAYKFRMMLTGHNIEIGAIDLRISNSHHILMYAGHIGYSVYPAYRGHHYAARGVLLLLSLARSHDLNPLWITCNPDNFASRRSCELAGFEMVEIVDLPPGTDMYLEGERQKCRYRRYL